MDGSTGHRISSCTNCRSGLAHDQRYCVECGTRRGPLPPPIRHVLSGVFEQGQEVARPGQAYTRTATPQPHWWEAWALAPRAAAASVMGVLGFGALVGSMVGGGVASPLETMIVAMAHPSNVSSASGAGNGGDGGGYSGPLTITEQQTIQQGGSSGGSGGGGVIGGGGVTSSGTTTPLPNPSNLPPVKHVFVVMLTNQGYQQTFGHPADDPYLGQTLAQKGELMPNYYAVAGGPLANEVALISGQGPTPKTVENCPVYGKIKPAKKGPKGQVLGDGCEYPKYVRTIATQLAAAKQTWKVYLQTAGPIKAARSEMCRPRLGATSPDPTPKAPYAAWRNPFLYFQGAPGAPACPKTNVPLTQLTKDLKSADTTPTLSYIVPDACDDGSGLVCKPGAPTGLAATDAFLKSLIPKILKSPAYKADGAIAITFDQAPQTGPNADHSSCCDNPTYPNDPSPYPPGTGSTAPGSTAPGSTAPGSTAPTGTTTGAITSPLTTTATTTTGTSPTATTPTGTGTTTGTPTTPGGASGGSTSTTGGGGQVGMLVLSHWVAPGTQDVTDYFNHFSLLGSIEDLFSFKRLGYTKDFNLSTFQAAVWSKYVPGQ